MGKGTGVGGSGSSSSSSGNDGKVRVVIGDVKLRRSSGRPRRKGQDPKALIRVRKQVAAEVRINREQQDGIDSYLDDDYLREEARRVYRPEDFHVAVKNEYDHDETMHVRIHPVMKGAIEDLVRNGPFPFSTPQDVLRVGALELMKRLYRLSKTQSQVTNWIAQLETISRILFRNEQLLSFEGSLDTLRKTVERFKRQGKLGERQAAKMVLDVRDAAKKLDAEWSEWYLEKIDDEYQGLIDRATTPVRRVRRGA